MVDMVRQQLAQARQDQWIKALVLNVDSPGGGITASDVIYHEVLEYKKAKGVKVVACMGDIAASGGYYVSLPADLIMAHPTSITGSIGVISYEINAQMLMEKLGVDVSTIKSAPMKDLGSPFRPMTPEERALLQGVIDELYERFLRLVSDGRGIPLDKARTLADGRIYTAKQALANKLIDRIGYRQDAIEEAKKLAGLKKAKVVWYEKAFSLMDILRGVMQPRPTISIDVRDLAMPRGPVLMYLWTGRRPYCGR